MSIHDLPLETIEEILLFADPIDLASLSQSSKLFAQLIYQQEDQRLWRWLYLIQELDDPRQCVYMDGSPRDIDSIDWKAELQAVVRARSILDNHRPNDRRGVLTTLVKLVECVPPLPTVSKNIVWVASYIADGTLLDRHGDQDETEEQLQAQLHTYYGRLPQDEFIASTVRSRAYVYDFRHYNWATDFGPFFEDGRINWVHLQAIQHTLSVHTHSDMNERPHLRMTLPSTQISLSDKEDWAGVSGNWQCGFCFCDHGSLTDFNRTDPPDVSFFEDPDNGDVCRSISVDLQIIQIAKDPKHPHHPRIYFGGNMGNQTSATMSGYVCMSDDNHVRWRFRSGEQLNPIWSSEGVQIGGLSSTYGVLGSWTTTFHDPLDPVGPFWLRKTIDLSLASKDY